MAFYLSRLNPVPAFPEYSGPYRVGTVDVEIPVADLESPSPAPSSSDGLHTVQFRVFYPASPDADGRRITWLPAPQRSHVSAYTQFLGVGPLVAEVVSFLPRHLHYASIPALKNAPLLEPTTPSGRWPVMVFSHGLGGCRNAYSHVAGSVASHGLVVFCPEHRDGSAVVSFVRNPAAQNRFFRRSTRSVVPYKRIPHVETPEVWAERDRQLQIRLWELGLVHDAILRLDAPREPDEGVAFCNLNTSTPPASLAQFADRLEVHNPGDIIWAGHSFGSTTMVQLLKTTYYAETYAESRKDKDDNKDDDDDDESARLLFAPAAQSRLRAQITERSPAILLDMWCFPLLSPTQKALFRLPLPVYADVPGAIGGSGVLAVGSETFFKWTPHLHVTAKVLSPDPESGVVSAASFVRPSGVRLSEPNFFYVEHSAHLNQSDFGLLFPWLTKKVFGAEQPERAMRLNLRAILQMLRANGVPVARTWVGDLVDGFHETDKPAAAAAAAAAAADAAAAATAATDCETATTVDTPSVAQPPALAAADPLASKSEAAGIHDDTAIFSHRGDCVDAWQWIDIVGLGAAAPDSDGHGDGSKGLQSPERDGVNAAVDAAAEAAAEAAMGPAAAA